MFWSRKSLWSLNTILIISISLLVVTGSLRADYFFGTPTNLGPTVNSSAADPHPSISPDGLELYFDSFRPGQYGNGDIWVTTRVTVDDEWGEPTHLGQPVNSSHYDGRACLTTDGLSLYFWSGRSGGYGGGDIWVTTRATRNDDWGTALNLGPTVNSSDDELYPSLSFDGLQLFFCEYSSFRPGGVGKSDLWTTVRPTVSDPWGPPLNLGPTVNSSDHDRAPSISSDRLMLFFTSKRSGGQGEQDIWVARRATIDAPWAEPVNLGPMVNSSAKDAGPNISADGRTLYFHSNRPGGYGNYDLWQATIEPVVDLNADGIVDAADMCIVVDYWGTDEPLCDIGPMPWGDGIVDVQDLIVLAEHLFEEFPPADPNIATP